MKIVYCTDSICYPGGIQRITIAKANALAEIEGNEVWIIVTDNKRPKPVLPISGRVHLVDLDVNYFKDDWKSKIHVLKGIFVNRRKHRMKLKELLNTILPDVVISTGTSEKFFLPHLNISSNPVFVREIHFTSNYRKLAAEGLFDKISALVSDFIDYHGYISRYDRVVVLTHEDKDWHWKQNKKVVVIYNPLTIRHIKQSSLKNKKVVAAGRLTAQKNFSSLIRAWKLVFQSNPNWILEIWGNGVLKTELQNQIEREHLGDSVRLMGYTNDIIDKFSEASIFVCSSLFEGFGLVITEAMSCGIPVVSYSCPCGPKDIITDGKDGYLVNLDDECMLSKRINYLIENEDVRQQMGAFALEKSKQFSMDIIIEKWMSLFAEIIHEKEQKNGKR